MRKKLTTYEFIQKGIMKFGNMISYEKFIYHGKQIKSIFTCIKHGNFNSTPDSFIYTKYGCQKCANINRSITKTLKQDQIINKFIKIWNNRYTYNKFIYTGNHKKGLITCSKTNEFGIIHGDFLCTPNNHKTGSGCPICNESRNEIKIRNILLNNNINFTSQYKFNDCKNPNTNYRLMFDFYLPEYNMCIEFDGSHHYSPIFLDNIGYRYPKFHNMKNYLKNKFKDDIKNEYCNKNNILLLRIPFYEKELESIVTKFLQVYQNHHLKSH